MNILNKIIETKHSEIKYAVARRSYVEIQAEARAVCRPAISFSESLLNSATGIIAEFKRCSPSRGFINENANPETVAEGYTANGATAISVLTDKMYFGGSLDDLLRVRVKTALPILRKDFIIDPYQICEARIAGADVILLIAAALTQEQCCDLSAFATELGLEVLLEIHDESELKYINKHTHVVGINNRDLTTFVTDTAVSERVGKLLPPNLIRISESGISSPDTVRQLRSNGFRGFLMGENFMKQSDPGEALGQFIEKVSV